MTGLMRGWGFFFHNRDSRGLVLLSETSRVRPHCGPVDRLERVTAGIWGLPVATWLRSFAGELRGQMLRRFPNILGNWIVTSRQGDIDILEDLTRSDAKNTVGGFDQIIALASGVVTAENIGEGEFAGELPGFYEKAGAIGDPWIGCFHKLPTGQVTVEADATRRVGFHKIGAGQALVAKVMTINKRPGPRQFRLQITSRPFSCLWPSSG